MFIILSGIILYFDQWIKSIIRSKFAVNQSLPVIDRIFHLTYVQNRGAGFGILSGQRNFFIVVTLIIVLALVIYRFLQKYNIWLELATGFIIGGALGNLIDRVRLGYVVDFLDFRIWPVFNLADSAVVIGAGFLLIYLWQQEKAME